MKKFAIISAAMLLAPLSASAADFRFDYSGYDLTRVDHVAALHADLEQAASRYCREEMAVFYLAGHRSCTDEVLSSTVSQIGNSDLASLVREVADRRG